MALFSAWLQLSYDYTFVRNILLGESEYRDYDIVDLASHYNPFFGMSTNYIGKFKTRGFIYVLSEGPVYLESLSSQFRLHISVHSGDLPANGSFVEVRGTIWQEDFDWHKVRVVVYSWKYCNVGYEILIDLLTVSVIMYTFILLVWSGRVIGASIAFKAYARENSNST